MAKSEDVVARITGNMTPVAVDLSSLPESKRRSRILPENPLRPGLWWHCNPRNENADHECKGRHKQINPLPSSRCKCTCHDGNDA